MADTLNLTTLAKYFSDEEAAWLLVENLRWQGQPVCPHCGTVGEATFVNPKRPRRTSTGKVSHRRIWKCRACAQQFSVLVGTIFEDTKLPLSKWLLAIYMMCASKNGVAAYELHRTLGITHKSAWHMAHRIRLAMSREPMAGKLAGIVEADETYMGGKLRTRNQPVGEPVQRRTRQQAAQVRRDNKTPVVALVERGGHVRSQVMERVTRDNIGQVLAENIDESATLMTDSARIYTPPGRKFAAHESVNHGEGEYARGIANTNTVEGYFSQLKRSIDGTHHHVSAQHLGRYLTEFDFRYNTRGMSDGDRTAEAIYASAGKRLSYRPLADGVDA